MIDSSPEGGSMSDNDAAALRQNKPHLDDPSVSRIRVGCPAHNCGGRCLLIAHVRDGRIIRLETDDRPDMLAAPQLRACVRGRAYLKRQYHPDRLLTPLKRSGARGEGRFEPVSWDEALDTLAAQFERVKQTYGNSALFVPYGTGSYNQLNGSHVARRLMNLYGGCLGIYNSYSWAATNLATPTVYGTLVSGNQRQDWLNSKYILMWGWNPAEMRDGTNSDYFIKMARQAGARVVCIDPRHSLSAASLADEWIPIRPGTDAAMMSAMAYVIINENLQDEEFIRSHCVGFDASQMPMHGAESYSNYILGLRDGQPKTPLWAEAITAVPADTITRIAREYATSKPAMLYQGYGMQRRAYGEQVVRAGCVLAAITGNVGVPGGWASGLGLQAPDGGGQWTVFPVGENPVRAQIPVFLWTEAVLRGKSLTAAEGVRGVERLDNDIKLIYAVATNCLINQHADVNRSAAMLRDESKVEFIVAQDNFLTPTGRFADLILPACTQFETWGVEDGWKYGDEVILQPKLVEPPGECKSDYRICADLAERLGIGEAFTEGRDERGWTELCLDEYRRLRFPELPSLDEFLQSNLGAWTRPAEHPAVAFEDFRRDPENHPLNTPSGRIEIFSRQLYDLKKPEEIPAVPKYIQEWESPFDAAAEKYPLQAIGHHTLQRVHSTHDNNDWLEEAFPQRVFINPLDAADRKIQDGDEVRVFNERGALVLPCRVTPRIMPGVLDIPQGAWYEPDESGLDLGGCVNVLTSSRWTPFAFGTAQHTIMAQAERFRRVEPRHDQPGGERNSGNKDHISLRGLAERFSRKFRLAGQTSRPDSLVPEDGQEKLEPVETGPKADPAGADIKKGRPG
jgi:anaerobic dimethyl sulfoxide reductase subunit A